MNTTFFRPTLLPILPIGSPDVGFSHHRITSPYGWRDDPLNPGKRVFHGGVDIGNHRSGDILVAISTGSVIAEGFLLLPWSVPAPPDKDWVGDNYGGLMTVIDHGNGYISLYAHQRATYVEVGDGVEIGQRIGEIGDTGSAKGQAHVHFGLQFNGVWINPYPYFVLEGEIMYQDVAQNNIHKADIERASDLGIMNGVSEDPPLFNPKGNLTREQAASVAVRTFDAAVEAARKAVNGE